MNEQEPPPIDRLAIQRVLRRVDGFAPGLRLDDATARRVVEEVITDMPTRTDDDRLMEVRKRLLIATE
ncbi:hypothetical protein [Methylobacterium sp. E-046]|uniref:hypothetical protein n=1 Tax=Methylobacterium sp. E-046 TaxID=2836576 RepID=UPI001FB8AA1D|nr:hypothetical protein [Methylobacterium sp. E-046]MCJ2101225.1 hypothetical protein [Methylobacterium sp. E-046]